MQICMVEQLQDISGEPHDLKGNYVCLYCTMCMMAFLVIIVHERFYVTLHTVGRNLWSHFSANTN